MKRSQRRKKGKEEVGKERKKERERKREREKEREKREKKRKKERERNRSGRRKKWLNQSSSCPWKFFNKTVTRKTIFFSDVLWVFGAFLPDYEHGPSPREFGSVAWRKRKKESRKERGSELSFPINSRKSERSL